MSTTYVSPQNSKIIKYKELIVKKDVSIFYQIVYMAHGKVNSPEHLKNGEIFFGDTP